MRAFLARVSALRQTRFWRSPRWQAPIVPIVALLTAGAVLVVHGEPTPVQRNSGVSVPVKTDSPDEKTTPDLLVLSAGRLSVVSRGAVEDTRTGDFPPVLSVQQVTLTMSVALVAGVEANRAVLFSGGEVRADLGPAERVVPGAQPAVVAVQHNGVVTRYSSDGGAVGAPVTLPAGMHLAADTTLGIIAATQVGPLPVLDDGDAQQRSQERAAMTRSAMQRGELWTPMGAYQPLAAHGGVALLWNPLLRQLGLLDLSLLSQVGPVRAEQLDIPASTSPTASSSPLANPSPSNPGSSDAAPTGSASESGSASGSASESGTATVDPTASLQPEVARSLLPVTYPSVPGIQLTGPATFSPDGSRISVAGQVGQRPRLAVGQVPPALVRAETELEALEVISLGGELRDGELQPTPLWSGSMLICARLDGTVAIFSLRTGKATSHELTSSGQSDAPLSDDTALPTPSPTESAPPRPPVNGLGPG